MKIESNSIFNEKYQDDIIQNVVQVITDYVHRETRD